METYFQVFVNFEQNNWAQLLSMTKFVYNNVKNTNIGKIFLSSITDIILIYLIKDLDICLKSKTMEELSFKL